MLNHHSHPCRREAAQASTRVAAALFALACSLTLAACGGGGDRDRAPVRSGFPPLTPPADLDVPPVTIAVDGNISDWPFEHAAVADEHYLYLRFQADRVVTLQANDEALMIQLDADADPDTGRRDGALGIDLTITFSPIEQDGSTRGGTRIEAIDRNGTATAIPAAALDITIAPTHASDWFEIRVARRIASAGVLPNSGLLSAGAVAGRVVLFDTRGRPVAAAEPFRLDVVPAAFTAPLDAILVPERSLDAVRIVAYNVLNNAPDTAPEPFSRMFRAMDPDIVLVQEWYDKPAEQLAEWFNTNLPIDGSWSAVTSQGRGVAVVSRYELQPLGPPAVTIRPEDEARTVRLAAALVDTPVGIIAAASVHLKCCGGLDSREDTIRTAEAHAIAKALDQALEGIGPHARVIGGDYNLVGGTAPLRAITKDMDLDGSDLDIAEPYVLGDPTLYTWTDARSRFLPGRLDYIVYSGANLTAERAFVFDPARLDASALDAMNLDVLDARQSDHRPIVIDVQAEN
ncbi:MAG: endonuclease/exonuclease/phosphatase family protein [Planctomycetota bacterium]